MELKIDDLSLNYFGHADSLHSITHTFKSGLNVLFGVDGSGKTSLLKAIAGINYAHDGSITIDSQPLVYGKQGRISFVFDDLAFFERRSLKYNLTYPLKLRKMPKQERIDFVKLQMDKFSLSPNLLDVAAFRLSSEDRVKAALMRGFYRDSEIILLDNPLKNLDLLQRKQVFLQLVQLFNEHSNSIIIYATDSAEEVRFLNAQTLVLSFGYKVGCGLPTTFISNPQCLATSISLIPYFNYFDCELTSDGFKVFDSIFSIDLSNTLAQSFVGKKVVVGFTPQAVVSGDIAVTIAADVNTAFGKLAILKYANHTIYSQVAVDCFGLDLSKILLFDSISERVIYSPQQV